VCCSPGWKRERGPLYPARTDHRSLMASLSPKGCRELDGFDRSSQGGSQHALESTNHRHEPVDVGGGLSGARPERFELPTFGSVAAR
jgi:hypothetical protein